MRSSCSNSRPRFTGEWAIIENVVEICCTGHWPDFKPKQEEYLSSCTLACDSFILGYGPIEDLADRLKIKIHPIRKESDAGDSSTPIVGLGVQKSYC